MNPLTKNKCRLCVCLALALAAAACSKGSDDEADATRRVAEHAGTMPAITPEVVATQAADSSHRASVQGPIPMPKVEGAVLTTASGLKYIDIVAGKGLMPQSGQQLTVDYTGWLSDGTMFDSSRIRPDPFPFMISTGAVIAGWDEGVISMKVGGKRRLIIPPQLAYGAAGQGQIPPNATLTFDVELLNVAGAASQPATAPAKLLVAPAGPPATAP